MTASLSWRQYRAHREQLITSTISVSGSGASDAADLGFGAANNTFPPTNLLTQGLNGQNSDRFGRRRRAADHHLRHRQQATSRRWRIADGRAEPDRRDRLGEHHQRRHQPVGDRSDGDARRRPALRRRRSSVSRTPTVAPGNGTVIGSDLTTFTNQSVDGGSITAYDTEGNPLNIQFRWAQVGSSSGDKHLEFVLPDQFECNRHASRLAERRLRTSSSIPAASSSNRLQACSRMPRLTVNGDTLSNVEINFGIERPDAVRQYQRCGAGHPNPAKRFCRRATAVGRGR